MHQIVFDSEFWSDPLKDTAFFNPLAGLKEKEAEKVEEGANVSPSFCTYLRPSLPIKNHTLHHLQRKSDITVLRVLLMLNRN